MQQQDSTEETTSYACLDLALCSRGAGAVLCVLASAWQAQDGLNAYHWHS